MNYIRRSRADSYYSLVYCRLPGQLYRALMVPVPKFRIDSDTDAYIAGLADRLQIDRAIIAIPARDPLKYHI